MMHLYLLPVLLLSLYTPSVATQTTHSPSQEYRWIQKFASIGDSYGAGLGAGSRTDLFCSRYDHAYPALLHSTYLPPASSTQRTAQFLACSGAKTLDILHDQVPRLEKDINLLTISTGGNDIGLSPILNDCIYQFWFANTADCTHAIEEAERRIANRAELYDKIFTLIEAVRPKMNATHGAIYLTGYSRFFGVEDHTCDNVTWAVWGDMGDKQYLKLDLRRQLNDMVLAVNGMLRRVARDAGSDVRFVDYDGEVEKRRARYCEKGVLEPQPMRKGLGFYEWDTVDEIDDVAALERMGDDVRRGSFEGEIAERIDRTLQEHPEWEFDPAMGKLDKNRMNEVGAEGMVEDVIWWLLPDKWKRVFHPRPEVHAVIASLIVEDLARRSEQWEQMLLLLKVAGAGLVLVILLVLPLFLANRRRKSRTGWMPAWAKRTTEEVVDEEYCDDGDTLAEEPITDPPVLPAQDVPKIKNYNTFN
jgi:hypothetical protein